MPWQRFVVDVLLAEDTGDTPFFVDFVVSEDFAVSGGEASLDCGDVFTIVVLGWVYGCF